MQYLTHRQDPEIYVKFATCGAQRNLNHPVSEPARSHTRLEEAGGLMLTEDTTTNHPLSPLWSEGRRR